MKPQALRIAVAPAFFTLAVLTACGGENAPATVVQDSAGVSVIVNDPERPEWARDQVWYLDTPEQPDLQLGNQPGAPGHELYGVEHAWRLRDGRIVVANGGFGDLRLFDATGLFLERFLSPEGDAFPSAARPIRIVELGADSVLVALADGRLAPLQLSGRLTRAFRPQVPDGVTDPLRVIGRFADGSVLIRGAIPFDSVGSGVRRHRVHLGRYGLDGERIASFGEFDDRSELLGDGLLVFAAEGAFAASDSTVWYGDESSFELREVGSEGRTLRIVRLGLEPIPVTKTDTSTYRQNAIAQLQRTATSDAALDTAKSSAPVEPAESTVARYSYPATFPAYSEIVVDEPGNVWVRHYQWFDIGSEKRWSVFAPDGHYLGDVLTPNLLEIYQIGEDFVLGRMASSRGREAVYLFKLTKPAPAP
jgi:hypothetical protein